MLAWPIADTSVIYDVTQYLPNYKPFKWDWGCFEALSLSKRRHRDSSQNQNKHEPFFKSLGAEAYMQYFTVFRETVTCSVLYATLENSIHSASDPCSVIVFGNL